MSNRNRKVAYEKDADAYIKIQESNLSRRKPNISKLNVDISGVGWMVVKTKNKRRRATQTTMTFKTDDKVVFEHVGRTLHGTVSEEPQDGKVRIKDNAGYSYRIPTENVQIEGAEAPQDTTAATAPTITQDSQTTKASQDSQTTNTNNLTEQTMAKKATPAPKKAAAAKPAKAAVASTGDHKNITGLTCKKHQRIYLLMEAGCGKEEIMSLAGCNAGEISNVKKLYADKPEKCEEAKALLG